jgi:2-polyprenyl-3-methyl-5-hydroxy-6-metoxy-1,4-benzoquinol methylase
MPEPTTTGNTRDDARALEAYWEKRFEASARAGGDDAARNIGHGFGHEERRVVFRELVARHLPRHAASVLDVGCGGGTYFDLYAQLGLRIQGLDFSAAQLEVAHRRWPDARLVAGELSAAPADLVADLVVCIGVVQVVSDLPAFVAGIARRVTPGGIAIVSCLEKRSIWPGRILDPHLRFYGRAHMRGLFAPHFEEVDHRRFYPLPRPFSIVRPLLYRTQAPWLNHGLMFVLRPRRP